MSKNGMEEEKGLRNSKWPFWFQVAIYHWEESLREKYPAMLRNYLLL